MIFRAIFDKFGYHKEDFDFEILKSYFMKFSYKTFLKMSKSAAKSVKINNFNAFYEAANMQIEAK